MCDFLSVLINPDCDKELKIYVDDLRSHSETVAAHKLKPEQYREVEWTADTEKSLSVRCLPTDGDHDENWYRACILAEFPTRKQLIKHCLNKLPSKIGGALDVRGCDLNGVKLPAGVDIIK